MNERDSDELLAGIQTRPDLLRHGNGEGERAVRARQELVMMYYGAAYRYLVACLRDAQAAEDLAQHFATRLMEGNYIRQADPGQGRFRDYLKRSLHNLVADHRKKVFGAKKVQPLPEDSAAYGTADAPEVAADQAFLDSVREELVHCGWQALAQVERDSGTPYESVLRLKTTQSELRSAQIADRLGGRFGQPFTETGIRQLLRRAREKFAQFLVDHVQSFLQTTDLDAAEELLIELGLLELCKQELSRRRSA